MQTPYKGEKKIGEYVISHTDYSSYFSQQRNFKDLLKLGISGSKLFAK